MIWFLRLFQAYRDLEAKYERLSEVVWLNYPPTTDGLANALAVTARAVAPCFIRVEVVAERSPEVPLGVVRIVLREPL